MPAPARKQTKVRLPESLIRAAKAQARRDGVTYQATVEAALRAYLKQRPWPTVPKATA